MSVLKSSTSISPSSCTGIRGGSSNKFESCGTFGIKKHAGTETNSISITCPKRTSHSNPTQLQFEVVLRRSNVDIPASSVINAPAMTAIILPKLLMRVARVSNNS